MYFTYGHTCNEKENKFIITQTELAITTSHHTSTNHYAHVCGTKIDKTSKKFKTVRMKVHTRPPVSATSPDMSYGYAFMQHFTNISIIFPP